MGATGWRYLVPYEADIEAAFKKLQARVFAEGEFLAGVGVSRKEVEKALRVCGGDFDSTLARFEKCAADESAPQQTRERFEALAQQLRGARTSSPNRSVTTIEQLLEQQGETGTHSILDIRQICSQPEFGAISPLPESTVLRLFGTSQPATHQIEAMYERGELEHLIPERWQGIYIVGFTNGIPTDILFVGKSGD